MSATANLGYRVLDPSEIRKEFSASGGSDCVVNDLALMLNDWSAELDSSDEASCSGHSMGSSSQGSRHAIENMGALLNPHPNKRRPSAPWVVRKHSMSNSPSDDSTVTTDPCTSSFRTTNAADLPLLQLDRQDSFTEAYHEATNVRFGSIQVREYPQILGDNPACTDGPSLSIGWEYQQLPSLSVNQFEKIRCRRINKRGLLLSRKTREGRLRSMGYSQHEIASAVRSGNKIRTQRQQSVHAAQDMLACKTGVSWILKQVMHTTNRQLKGV